MNKKGYKKGVITQSLRRDILERDNRMCQKCGYSDIDCLEIHHIDKNPMNNNPSNLITFCRQCHLGVHNRKYNGREGYLGKLKGNEDEFTTLWGKGKTYNEIMHFFDISFVTVNNWRRKLELQRRQNVKKLPNGFKYNNNGTIRISLDVTQGTFDRLGELCNEKFQNKAEVLRECLNNRFKEEGTKNETE